MKKLKYCVLIFFLALTSISRGQTVLYSEDFNSYNDGATNGFGNPAKWYVSYLDDGDLYSDHYFAVENHQFRANKIRSGNLSIAYLNIPAIDISEYESVKISIRIPPSVGTLDNGSDYLYIKYSTDGGSSWTTPVSISGAVDSEIIMTETGITGSSLRIQFAFANSGADENYYADDIVVTGYNSYPSIWMRADKGITASSNLVSWWADQALGLGVNTTHQTSAGPVRVNNAFNFNPAIRFDGNDRAYRSISNNLINTTDNTCLVVQRFESGNVIFAMGQDDMSQTRRFNFVSTNGNPRFDFPNHSTNDGRLTGTSSMVNQLRLYTLQSTASQNKIYFNGSLHASKNRSSTLTTGQGDYSIYLGSNIQSGNHSTTQIAELIFFNSNPEVNTLTSWSSYLALKYGITLGGNGSATAYLDSDEETIWNASNTYHYDVAGIGNDGTWEFSQRVSSSSNTSPSTGGDVTLATINDFQSTNDHSSRSELNDGQFLIWGHNNAGYSSWNYSTDYKYVSRFWKVQNTDQVGDLFLRINLSGFPSPGSGYSYTIIIDTDTNPSNGIWSTYDLSQSSGSVYTTDINFPAGTSYFTVAQLQTKAPVFWLKADAGTSTTSDNSSLSSWTDQIGERTASNSNSSKRPTYQTNEANYNPVVRFDGSNDFLDVAYTSVLNPDFITVVSVQNLHDASSNYSSPYTSRDDFPTRGYIVYATPSGTYQYWTGKGDSENNEWHPFSLGVNATYGKLDIVTITGALDGGYLSKRMHINGQENSTTVTTEFAKNTSKPFRVGAGATENSSGNYMWDGDIPEIIIYPTILSNERERVQTFLALKYGIKLGHDYKAKSGIVYSISGYENDIAGIGRDVAFGLDQKISRSQNVSASASASVTIATTNNFSSDNQSGSRSSLEGGQFLIWGHNNGSVSSWQTNGDYKHVARRWKIHETGGIDDVHVQINLSNFPSAPGYYYLLIDNDTNLSNGITRAERLSNTSGSYYYASIDFPDGANYFSVGYSTTPQMSLWLKADVETSSGTDNSRVAIWYDQSNAENDASQSVINKQGRYQENEINFNPTVRFDGTEDFYTLSSTDGLAYGATERTSFIVAKDDNADQSSRAVWSYGSPSTGQAWAIKKHGSSNGAISLVAWGNIVTSGNWNGTTRIVTGAYNGSQLRIHNQGGDLQTASYAINTSPSVINIARHANNNEYWDGEIAEIIHYVGTVDENLRNNVETYLALKYGITLQTNYTSGNTTLFTVNDYGYEIAGIGRNTSFGLDQKVSSSIETTSGSSSNIVISTTNDYTSPNLSNSRTSLDNHQYLIWGHNNSSTSSWITSGDYKHVERWWQVQNTSNVSEVYFQINLSNYPSPQLKYYLIVDSNNNPNDGIVSTYELSPNGNLYTATPTFGNGTSYFTIGYEELDLDCGDAPDSYSTLIASNGPVHEIVSGVRLGNEISIDQDGFRNGTDSNENASDDTNDDGVTFNPSLNISTENILEAGSNTLRVNASTNGYVCVWVDLNRDGDFADSGEKVINNSAVSSGDNDLSFSIANTNKHGFSYSRIRFYTSNGEVSSSTGFASDGEVEDYQVNIVAERPEDICSNLIANPSFETPDVGNNNSYNETQVEGWNSSVGLVEIWQTGGVSNIPSQHQSQLAELNVNGVTTYFQDVITTPGETMSWQIYHRARSGSNQINFKLGPPGNTISIQNITSNTSWTQYTGNYTVPDGQHITRFEIISISPTNGGGNLLDNIEFTVNDNTAPVISAPERNVSVNNANCTYLVSGSSLDATASDNCSVSSLTHNYDGGGSTLDGKSFPVGSTDVSWTSTDSNGNSTTQIMQIVVTTDLAVSLSGPENNSACSGTNSVFTATASGGTANYTYTFYVNNVEVSNGVTDHTFSSSTLSDGDIIKVRVTDNYSCTKDSEVITITIFAAPSPVLYHE